MLTHVAQRLVELHKEGFVHRDIEPANIMWLPSQKRWTIIDFCCVARTSHDVPLAFTTAYAPPEAIQVPPLQPLCSFAFAAALQLSSTLRVGGSYSLRLLWDTQF